MTDQTSEPPLHIQPIADSTGLDRFLLKSIYDVSHILRQLASKHNRIALYFQQGRFFTLTTVLHVDQKRERFVFDRSGSAEMNRRLLESDRNIFVANPDGIKTQFTVGHITEISYQDEPAFEADFPSDVIKLQRREFFRIATPIVRPLVCQLFDDAGRLIDLPIHDISLGGLCFTLPKPSDKFPILHRFERCSIDLPGLGPIRFGLEVRNSRLERQANGSDTMLVGCLFLDLNHSQQNLLQRYITILQKERLSAR